MGMDWEQKWIILERKYRFLRDSGPEESGPAISQWGIPDPILPVRSVSQAGQSSLKVCSEELCYWMRCCHDFSWDTFVFKVSVSRKRIYLECWGQQWNTLRAACPWWCCKPKGSETQALFVSDIVFYKQWLYRMQIPQSGFPDSATQQHTGSPFARHHVIWTDMKHRQILSGFENKFRARQRKVAPWRTFGYLPQDIACLIVKWLVMFS